ncbi:MAG TPA: hypothetical protein VL326_35900 [Kofleriaceae bacterium]|nr:hypothetical protein [Kofleriaceae bacterium]
MSSRARLRIALVVVGIAAAIAVAIILLLTRHDSQTPTGAGTGAGSASSDLSDPLVAEFRETERNSLTTFNAALARQRRNEIDEVGLALEIDEHVLPAWHALRTKLDAATPPTRNAALYAAIRRYLAARETAWQAYVAGLRSQSDADARRHYDAYHANDADADNAAREIGALFRAANP